MNEWGKMLAGQLYNAQAPELLAARRRAQTLCKAYNATGPDARQERRSILAELLGRMGQNCVVEPPFRCDYGENITLGDNFYANYDLILLDICPIAFGQNVMIGPRVSFFAASHPIDAAVRASGLENGAPITVGSDVWIGGHVVVNPGVSIGAGTIVGSGAVVTADIPAGVIAAGNPCRVLREITPADRAHWEALAAEYHRPRPS